MAPQRRKQTARKTKPPKNQNKDLTTDKDADASGDHKSSNEPERQESVTPPTNVKGENCIFELQNAVANATSLISDTYKNQCKLVKENELLSKSVSEWTIKATQRAEEVAELQIQLKRAQDENDSLQDAVDHYAHSYEEFTDDEMQMDYDEEMDDESSEICGSEEKCSCYWKEKYTEQESLMQSTLFICVQKIAEKEKESRAKVVASENTIADLRQRVAELENQLEYECQFIDDERNQNHKRVVADMTVENIEAKESLNKCQKECTDLKMELKELAKLSPAPETEKKLAIAKKTIRALMEQHKEVQDKALSLSYEVEQKKEDVRVLRETNRLQQPLTRVGIAIRKRFMELAKSEKLGSRRVLRRKIIQAGNDAAHAEDIAADAAVFAIGSCSNAESEVFHAIYGAKPNDCEGAYSTSKDVQDLIDDKINICDPNDRTMRRRVLCDRLVQELNMMGDYRSRAEDARYAHLFQRLKLLAEEIFEIDLGYVAECDMEDAELTVVS